MKPNVVKRGMARRAASAIAMTLCLAAPALAGDRALIDIVGYSPDNRYFAFEEYGIQDGSGFPYATVYVVDIEADKWVAGSPFRARLDDESAALADARAEAGALARGTIDDLAITEPASFIALNGDGAPVDGMSLDFGAVGYGPGEVVDESRLDLQIFEAAAPGDCATFVEAGTRGFALTLDTQGQQRELHRDGATLPASRGCATTYRIYGVVAPAAGGSLEGGVAIVSNYPFGFEGPDRRFLAVPLGN